MLLFTFELKRVLIRINSEAGTSGEDPEWFGFFVFKRHQADFFWYMSESPVLYGDRKLGKEPQTRPDVF